MEDVLLTEYNEIEHINNEKKISYEEGVQDAFDVLARLQAGESRENILLSGVNSSVVDEAERFMNRTL